MARLAVLAAVATLAATPVLAQDAPAVDAGEASTARATFVDRDGNAIGDATLTGTPNGVLIRADLENLPPGTKGFHFHEVGECDPAGGFDSAGDHYDPAGSEHGFHPEGGPHAGDMANQTVGADGRLVVEVVNERVSLEGGEAPLLDDDGTAIVLHADADDYRSQPSGDAGDRIACAVVESD